MKKAIIPGEYAAKLQVPGELANIRNVAIQKMSMKHLFAWLLLLFFGLPVHAAKPPPSSAARAEAGPAQLRVLVALGPSTYFFRGGRPHGVEYAWLLDFEKFMNRDRPAPKQIRLKFIPVDPGELIPALYDGRGDMAAGLIPASDGVRKLVALTDPFLVDSWCAAVSRQAKRPENLDDLASSGVVLPSTSYAKRLLLDENESRRLADQDEIVVTDADMGTTTEKLLREAHAGSKQPTLASRFVINLWRKVFPRATQGVCLDTPVPLVWAVNHANPQLLGDLNRFISSSKSKFVSHGITLTLPHLFPNGVGKPSQTIDPLDKLAFFAPLFQLAAAANDLDWLLLAAIGQRETGLSAVKAETGPTGVMQMSPATAQSMGVKNPHDTQQNITAAARYLNRLRKMYTDPAIAAEDRLYFMLAAYNAGEGRLQGLRSQAAAQGLDPNRWHGHVEVIAQRSIGQQIVNYVTAVSRYYMAYQQTERGQQPGAKSLVPTKP